MSIDFRFASAATVRRAYGLSIWLQQFVGLRGAYAIDRGMRAFLSALRFRELPEIVWAGERYFVLADSRLELEGSFYAEKSVKLRMRGPVRIGSKVRIRQGSVITNNGSSLLSIGENTNIGESVTILTRGTLEIGRDVMIGPGCAIVAETHGTRICDQPFVEQEQKSSGITIGANVWLGANVVVVDGVRVGENSIVAAGTVVMRNVPAFSLVAGSPGRVVRTLIEST